MPSIRIHISEDLLASLQSAAALVSPADSSECVALTPDRCSWDKILLRVDQASTLLQIFILPLQFILENASSAPLELLDKIMTGTARFAYISGDFPSTPLPFPVTWISEYSPFKEISLHHLFYATGPGAHSVLPAGTPLYSDRLMTDKEIGRKCDQAIQFAATRGLKLAQQTLRVRTCMNACLTMAFSDLSHPRKATSAIAFQIGANQERFVLSVRWKTAQIDPTEWNTPKELLTLACRFSDLLFIHLIPESSEVETLAVFHPSQPLSLVKAGLPAGIDILTNARLALMHTESNNARAKEFAYGSIQKLPLDEEAKVVSGAENTAPQAVTKISASPHQNDEKIIVKGSPATSEQSEIMSTKNTEAELATLRVERQKLLTAVEKYKEQFTGLSKRLHDALETERKSSMQVKALEIKLQQANAKGQMPDAKKQQEALLKRLDTSKARELDLTRKLGEAVQEIKRLQGSSSK